MGRHTNFFEAGGSSLLAARLQLDLPDRLGGPVRLVDLFARPTVAEFVAGLDGPTGPGSDAPDAPADDAAARGTRRRSAVRARARGRAAARGGTASPLGTDIPTSPDAPTSSDTATGSGTPTGRD
ncbi:hypothetical protein GCM10009566_74800 [Streptomyces murinus]